MPWQRAFVGLFLEHRETYGMARFLLADEVGVGKTLSLATAALVVCLLGDGPALILCPATLVPAVAGRAEGQARHPSAVWLSNRKVWLDPNGTSSRPRGAEDVGRCPYQIGIVSTGLIFHDSPRSASLAGAQLRHPDPGRGAPGAPSRGMAQRTSEPNNLLWFMMRGGRSGRNTCSSGTATPIQTDVEDLWDLLEILGMGAEHVLGRWS